MKPIRRLVLTQLILIVQAVCLAPALGDSVGSYYLPLPQHEEAAPKLALGSADSGNGFSGKSIFQLPYPKDLELDSMRKNNTRASAGQAKALQVGFARDIPDDLRLATSEPDWIELPGGMLAAQFSVVSPGAKALRVGLTVKGAFSGELRFVGSNKPQQVFGPYRRGDWLGQAVYWSPLTEGDTLTVEIVLPAGQKVLNGGIEVVQVSHIAVHPAQGNQFSNLVPTTASCEVDVECTSSSVVKDAAKGVARMSFVEGGKSYVCSGTLLNDKSSSQIPWFYTANHCISDQAAASTLNTFFFYENSGCYTGNTPKIYKQLTRGATFLDGSASNDHSFLRLNEAPPGGVMFNAWNTDVLVSGQTVVGIHHPHGDFKKVSSGMVGSPATKNIQDIDTGQRLYNLWSVTFDSGTTEPGSSGSGLFFCTDSQCELKGGLFGGPAGTGQECVDRRNSYSRFDVAYGKIIGYLNAATPTPTPATLAQGATYSNGVLTIKKLEVDAGVFGKIYYDVTMKLQADSSPLTLTVDTAVQSQ